MQKKQLLLTIGIFQSENFHHSPLETGGAILPQVGLEFWWGALPLLAQKDTLP